LPYLNTASEHYTKSLALINQG